MSERIELTLHDTLLRAARDVARKREITIQQLLKDALKSELARAHRKAKSPERADERMLAMLRARFAEDIAYANSWGDLQGRLRDKGVCFREAGGGLALFSLATGARLCKASDLGTSLGRLARRFRSPFPGDKQGHRFHYASAMAPGETRILDNEG